MRLPGFEQIGPDAGGSWAVDTGRTRLVLHTTEGWNIEGALSVYRNAGVWPHFTVDVRPGGRLIQHIDTSESAMALYNGPDPTQTNRAGVTLQVEICGFAAETHTYDDAWYQRLAVEVVAPICKAHGIPARCTRFYGQGEGVIASESWVGRWWADRLYSYAGILGHQTVGDGNDHWDPGRLDSERLLNMAFGGGVIVDPVTGQQRVVAGGTPTTFPLLEDEQMDFVRVPGKAEVYLRAGMFAVHMATQAMLDAAAKDFAVTATVKDIAPLSLAALVVLPADMGQVPGYLRSLGVSPVEVTAEEGDRWRTYGLVDGKPTHGGFVVSQLFGNVIEAATATRRNPVGLTLEQRAAAEVAAAVKPLLGAGLDVAALADALADELVARIVAKLGAAPVPAAVDPAPALTEALTP